MKKIIKPLALFSAAALLACASGCADTSWSFKTDDTTLSNGNYIYYTYMAYSEALSKIDEAESESSEASESSESSENEDVLSKEIDGKSVDEWIKDKATEECVAQMTIDKLIKEYDVKVDEEDLQLYEGSAEQWYQYYSTLFNKIGVSKDTYVTATGTYNGLSNQLFLAIYGEGGSKEVSQEDREAYFKENYTNYFYIPYSLLTTDDDGNSVSIDDTTLDNVKVNFAKYADMLNTQGKTTDDVVTEYLADFETETDPSESNTSVLEDVISDEELLTAISDLKENTATVTTIDDTYYLIYKGAIADQVSTLEDEMINSSLLHKMKGDEYNEYLDEEEAKLKYETNDACLSNYTIQRIIDIVGG